MLLNRVVAVRPAEVRAALWSFGYFFCLLAAYYVLRPLRDEMGVAGGVRNLQWLFTATFVTMLAAVPIYGALVARLPRRRFIPLVYHFFVLNLAVFWVLLALEFERQTVARVFFVWISVFVLFAVSVFWSFMADVWKSEQGKRLYGFIAAGGSAGALAGPLITIGLAGTIGTANLLIGAALLLEAAVLCARRLEVEEKASADQQGAVGGGAIDGLLMVVRSPYVAGITLWVSLLSVAATFLYFEQAAIVAAASDDPAVRTRIFASVDLAVGLPGAPPAGPLTPQVAETVARAAQAGTGSTHALAVLIDLDDGPDRIEFGGSICLAIATAADVASRRSRIVGGREWVRLGAVEMGLDCLRRHLQGLPVVERIDFEKV